MLISVFAQDWQNVNARSSEQPEIKATKFRTLIFSPQSMKARMRASSRETEINIPMPDGGTEVFKIKISNVLPANLREKYGIYAFEGYSVSNPDKKIRLEYDSEDKFHAMIFGSGKTYFIDPFNRKSRAKVISYYRNDFVKENKPTMTCGFHDVKSEDRHYLKDVQKTSGLVARSSGDKLATYRLAVATTKQYTNFHGGTVAKGLAAVTTTINRVTGIYEIDASVSFTLVPNNDQIIFTNNNVGLSGNNSNAQQLINDSKTTIDNKIGSANYDVGHTMSTGGGGLAGLGVVCGSGKARGITGSNQPVNDPYDVDFVAHEMGHQFNCPHTFNGSQGSCSGGNRSGNSAVEPGSGVTIMGYAGICGSDDILKNSIPVFHTHSQDKISIFTTSGSAKNCGTHASNNNTPPVVTVNTTNYTIPKSTPFKLEGTATDADGNTLTYSWEEMDKGSAGSPNSPSGDAPIFRSFIPKSTGVRYFPQLSDVVSGSQTKGEIMPSYGRNLKFRLTARDGKGGVTHETVTYTVSGTKGPFKVTLPNGGETYTGNQSLTVTWNKAGTHQTPINCQKVNILLSKDGGLTYPITLITATANDGSEAITIPNINTTKARIMVIANDNIFFDISNNNFTINKTTDPDFTLSSSEASVGICQGNPATITVTAAALNGFSGTISLSTLNVASGASVTMSPTSLSGSGSTAVTISNVTNNFTFKIKGVSGSIVREISIAVVNINTPSVFTVALPSSGELVGTLPTLSWNASTDAASYTVVVANNAQLSNPVVNEVGITGESYTLVTPLDLSKTYYWKVIATNNCGVKETTVSSFKTKSCVQHTQTTNMTINNQQTQESSLAFPEAGIINDVNLIKMKGTHGYVEDMIVKLISPAGTSVNLFSGACANSQTSDFNLGFDDASTVSTLPCPFTTGATFKPSGSLASFNSEGVLGDWKLSIEDNYQTDAGVLDEWTLEICYTPKIDGIDNFDNQSASFSVYPNPTSGMITINGKYMDEVNIVNILGETVGTYQVGAKRLEFNLANQSSGIYFIKIISGDTQIIKQVVKE